MWHEYPIRTNSGMQKIIIRNLRTWIEKLEAGEVISGFCFAHYSPSPDELRLRFRYVDENNREAVEHQLETIVKAAIPQYTIEERVWGDDLHNKHILEAYEFASRCAFLAWKLIENGHFPEDYFSNALVSRNQDGTFAFGRVPFEFQTHFNHGVMNSLGILKVPTAQNIHLNNLLDSTGCKTKDELIEWLQKHMA